jgi:outer membrane receptor protein involved in Fe transport
MRTHAHGQGYTDLNPLVPELIKRVDYVKGTYTTANGDLSTAGSADFSLFDVLDRNIATFEIGEDAYYRGLIAGSVDLNAPVDTVITGGKNPGKNPVQPASGARRVLTYALEYNAYDGPWALPEEFSRWNGLLRYFEGDEDNFFSLTFMGYRGEWQSTDQIPKRAIDDGRLDRFGFVDPTSGGDSQRYSLNALWQQRDGDVVTRANVFAIYYDLDLFSNFTYFLDNPQHGDQFNQAEERWVFGGNFSRTWENRELFGKSADFSVGLQTRHDLIDPIGLYKTERRHRLSTVRQDEVYEASVGAYAETTLRWNDWFRTNLGVRGDLFYFDTDSDLAANSGSDWDGIVTPKVSLVFGPWNETELYLNYGMGFHSNDARGVNTTRDPQTGDPVPPVDPLVRTQGAEFGVRSSVVPHLTTTLALFWLQSDSELIYIGDAGTNEAGPGSERYGIELAVYWRPVSWFSLDAEGALTHARFTDAGNEDYIPDSVPAMFSAGVTLGAQPDQDGIFASFRARAFDKRPLEETNKVKGKASFLVNGSIGYRRGDWEAALECLNIFDREDNDIEYFYTSRLPGEPEGGFDDIHLHPTGPRTFRLRVTYKF